MQQRRVEFRNVASGDLSELFEDVLNKSGSQDVAEAYVARVVATCRKIGEAAEGGRRRDDGSTGLRTWSFDARRSHTASSETSF